MLNPLRPAKNTNMLIRKAKTPYISASRVNRKAIRAIKPIAWSKAKKRLIAIESDTSCVNENLDSANSSALAHDTSRLAYQEVLRSSITDSTAMWTDNESALGGTNNP
jgi:hypothetical protein